jgi:hypothetical protein
VALQKSLVLELLTMQRQLLGTADILLDIDNLK